MISLIACMDKQQGIGINNQLPWHLPEDLRHFKRITTGKPIVMGRKTFESIGKPLPNRPNIILTREQMFQTPQCCFFYNSIERFLESDWMQKGEEIFVIGGSTIYKQFLPYADRLYLTELNAIFECDAFFPDVQWHKWKLADKKEGEEIEEIPYSFCLYERNERYGKMVHEKGYIYHDENGSETEGTVIFRRKAIYDQLL